MKDLILLGASGSIGTQTIDVVKHHSDEFKIVAVGAGSNINKLKEVEQIDLNTLMQTIEQKYQEDNYETR